MGSLISLACFGALMSLTPGTEASSFLPPATGETTVLSKRWPGASISYKQTSICETTPGVKAWSGYVSMPGEVLNRLEDVHDGFDTHIFFWFFESRTDPANSPTSIYLGGGPGYTSLDSTSNFPCLINSDSNSTTLNPLSWNNKVNMLYVEQPVGTGYSYADRKNGTFDVLTNSFTPWEEGTPLAETNTTTLAATMDPRSISTTLNTTAQAARVMWQFSQIWFQEFPEKPTTNDELSVWGNSYGGFWGPALLSHFITQNELVANKTHPNANATFIPLGTLGIGNGCIDVKLEIGGTIQMAYNNTYGIQVYNQSVYESATSSLSSCHDQIDNCRALAAIGDPTGQGSNATVNQACVLASLGCYANIQLAIKTTNISAFDIAQLDAVSDVKAYFNGFFNQRWVQEHLGARVNFTDNDYSYQDVMFMMTGDPMRRSVSSLEHVLSSGLKVALVYGDRDYQCSWFGAEEISLKMEYPAASGFRAAGYADVVTNSSYKGGLVRQHGNVSFIRLFDAPHAMGEAQPETVARVFERAMFGLDIGTGQVVAQSDYSSSGPLSSLATKNKIPDAIENECYVYIANSTCTPEQIEALSDGTAVVQDFIVTSPRGSTERGLTLVKESTGANPPAPTSTSTSPADALRAQWGTIMLVAISWCYIACSF